MRTDSNKNKKYIILSTVIIALVTAAWLLSKYVVQLMLVQGQSMEPTIKNRALLLVDKRKQEYKTNDIIVFSCEGIKGVLVKRIIAAEGDTVVIKAGRLYVNDKEWHTVSDTGIEKAGNAITEILIPKDCFFVIGDNINESIDSRFDEIGLVNITQIIGRVIKS